jgi:transglutaminase-like putative cysteine protease
MKERKGVCQDFAHLAIACLRSIGLPARYVSGYIETIPPPGVEKLVGVDASHAWFSVFIPGNGWVDFDPTNNMLLSDQHITIGWGRDYADITPLKGVIMSSGRHELKVSVNVKRMASPPSKGGI